MDRPLSSLADLAAEKCTLEGLVTSNLQRFIRPGHLLDFQYRLELVSARFWASPDVRSSRRELRSLHAVKNILQSELQWKFRHSPSYKEYKIENGWVVHDKSFYINELSRIGMQIAGHQKNVDLWKCYKLMASCAVAQGFKVPIKPEAQARRVHRCDLDGSEYSETEYDVSWRKQVYRNNRRGKKKEAFKGQREEACFEEVGTHRVADLDVECPAFFSRWIVCAPLFKNVVLLALEVRYLRIDLFYLVVVDVYRYEAALVLPLPDACNTSQVVYLFLDAVVVTDLQRLHFLYGQVFFYVAYSSDFITTIFPGSGIEGAVAIEGGVAFFPERMATKKATRPIIGNITYKKVRTQLQVPQNPLVKQAVS